MLATKHFSQQNPMIPNTYWVDEKIIENHDTVTLKIKPHTLKDQCQIQPGQFNMLYLFGVGEIPISVSNVVSDTSHVNTQTAKRDAANSTTSLWHTIRGVGTVSKGFLQLQPGDMLGVRGGFGIGWPIASCQGRDVLIITGGIGLAPLRPTIHALLNNRDQHGDITVIYGARSPADQIFKDELSRWSTRSDITFVSTVDHATTDWTGNVGVVTDYFNHYKSNPKNTTAMLCGPEIMMHFALLGLERLGITQDQIFVSMERSMKCAVGHCGHCQWGSDFMCKDGPVFAFSQIAKRFRVSGL